MGDNGDELKAVFPNQCDITIIYKVLTSPNQRRVKMRRQAYVQQTKTCTRCCTGKIGSAPSYSAVFSLKSWTYYCNSIRQQLTHKTIHQYMENGEKHQ